MTCQWYVHQIDRAPANQCHLQQQYYSCVHLCNRDLDLNLDMAWPATNPCVIQCPVYSGTRPSVCETTQAVLHVSGPGTSSRSLLHTRPPRHDTRPPCNPMGQQSAHHTHASRIFCTFPEHSTTQTIVSLIEMPVYHSVSISRAFACVAADLCSSNHVALCLYSTTA